MRKFNIRNIITQNKISVTKPIIRLPQRQIESLQEDKQQASPPTLEFRNVESSTPSVFSNTNYQAYESVTKTNSLSPKILALTDFLPIYSELNKLNETGELLQAKQDAILLSAIDAIKRNLLKFSEDEEVKNSIQTEKQNLQRFCVEFGKNIGWLLSCIENAKLSISNLSLSEDSKKFFKETNPYFKSVSIPEITEILGTDKWKDWTTTKTWLQMCSSFKDAMNHGVSLSNTDLFWVNRGQVEWDLNKLQDSTTLLPSKNFENKLKFNSRQLTLPKFFQNEYNVSENFDNLKSILQGVFESPNSSIFNIKMDEFFIPDDTLNFDRKSKSIAQLSYAICREIKFSTEIKRLNILSPETIANYGYPVANLNSTLNIDFLNYVIGESGKDITEISQNPKGAGRSLVSLSQFTATNAEVLTFEKRYVNDDIGNNDFSNRAGSILTPGTEYLIESALNFDAIGSNFVTTNATQYLSNVKVASKTLKKLTIGKDNQGFLFNKDILPRNNKNLLGIASAAETRANANLLTNLNLTLRHPLLFVRLIEQKLLTNLLPRTGDPANFSINSTATDYSTILISLGLQHSEILSLLYMYVIAKVNEINNRNNRAVYADANYASVLADAIQNSILEKFRSNISAYKTVDAAQLFQGSLKSIGTNTVNDVKKPEIELTNIHRALSRKVENNLRILNEIAKLISQILSEFSKNDTKENSSESFKKEDPNPFSIDEALETLGLSFYSGVQKESIMTGIFYLCCLMVHEANPDKITGIKTTRNDSKILIIQKKGAGATIGSVKERLVFNNSTKTPRTILNRTSTQNNFSFGSIKNLINLNLTKVKPTSNNLSRLDIARRTPAITVGSIGVTKTINSYFYDDIIINAEQKMWNELMQVKQIAARFICFIDYFQKNLESFVQQLSGNSNSRSFNDLNSISTILINEFNDFDANLKINQLMTIEQLSLLRSKLTCLSKRLSDTYTSQLRNVAPYFVSDKDDPNLELTLPIEDFHLVSWNFLLKEFFNKKEYLNDIAVNKKILSIGLPAKLYQSLQSPINASKLQKSKSPTNIIKIKIYMIDNLRPLLIHKPKEFLFDMNKFSIGVLNYYTDPKFLIETKNLAEIPKYQNIKYFPSLNLRNAYNLDVPAVDDFFNRYRTDINIYDALTRDETQSLIDNHIQSFALEEYLSFASECSFNESSFYKTSEIQRVDQLNIPFDAPTPGSVEFLKKNNLALGSQQIKSALLQPKKFDRVFHTIVDPDDFEIDINLTDAVSEELEFDIIQYYQNLQVISNPSISQVGGQAVESIKRLTAKNEEVEFYSFNVAVEAYA